MQVLRKHITTLAFVLLVAPLPAQVSVTLTPIPEATAKMLVGKRLTRVVTVWTAVVANESPDPVSVSEAAILRQIPQLVPFDHQAMASLVSQTAAKSGWARAGGVGTGLVNAAAFVMAQQGVRAGSVAMLVATGLVALGPGILAQLQQQAAPAAGAFESLAWTQPMSLGPGESASGHVFTQVWREPGAQRFAIDTANLGLRKLIQ